MVNILYEEINSGNDKDNDQLCVNRACMPVLGLQRRWLEPVHDRQSGDLVAREYVLSTRSHTSPVQTTEWDIF